METNNNMEPMRDEDYMRLILSRWPYMFDGKNIGLSVSPGWQSVFFDLCVAVDAVLPHELKAGGGEGFHWTQLKEKFGSARWYMKGATSEAAELIRAGQDKTCHTCLRCGAPGTMRTTDGWWRVLCDPCDNMRKDEPDPWRIWWDQHWGQVAS
jgi:hypothetical protein